MWKLINSLFLFLFAFGAQAQITVAAQLDSTTIMIGDQVNLKLVVNYSPSLKITGADYSALEQVENVEVLTVNPWDTILKSSEYVIEQDITLTSFDSGYYWIPKIAINYIDASGKPGRVLSRELALSVNTIPIQNDSVQLAPIKPIIEEPLKFKDALPFILIWAAIVSIILLIVFLIKRRKTKEYAPLPKVILPAHVIAFKQLEELKKNKLWQAGKIKEYQSELTRIVREYLENRFQIKALESTTYDIMRQLKRDDIPEDWKVKLKEMLETADLVKFAKAEPPVDIHAKVMEQAEAFVLQTKVVEVKQEETEEENTPGEEVPNPEIENENN